jgi:hypothetical protein
MRWRLVRLLLIAMGLGQVAYGTWSGRSDVAAAPVYERSESCQLRLLDPHPAIAAPSSPTRGACRLDSAVVVRASSASGKGGMRYSLVTVSSVGTRDYISLSGHEALALWRRAKPTNRLVLQRFVQPGYHLTGTVTALSDGESVAMSVDNPGSGAHGASVNVLLGALLALVSLLLGRRRPSPT